MFSGRLSKKFRSFAFYLGMGYLTVYALGTCAIFFLSSRVITKSARSFDKQDVRAQIEEFSEILNQNTDGNWLAEEMTVERYPPSTLFIVRVLSAKGHVDYAAVRPKGTDIPDWRNDVPGGARGLPAVGWSEYYLKPLHRHIQVFTARLKDGRTLQVGKGSFLEVDQKSMMARYLLIFMVLSTLLSFLSGIFMMYITLRPIHHITASMSRIIETGAFEHGAPPVNSLIAELDKLGRLFLVMTDKYASLIKAMRQTMDNVAHDFRTPLARIRGASELALHSKDIPAELADTLADIIEDCDRVQLQLQNLMDAREMESGFVKLNTQPFSLKRVIAEIADLYLLLAEEKSIALTAALPPEDDLTLEGDRHRITRAFANLVDNALKYTPKGGAVRIDFEPLPDAIITRVSDSGIGIPDDEKALIWQRLFRGKRARESEKGLGLGLNIVQIIVAAHGGEVTVESREGQGTTFAVRLPRVAPRGAQA
jgi:signal transduction histidine kinase